MRQQCGLGVALRVGSRTAPKLAGLFALLIASLGAPTASALAQQLTVPRGELEPPAPPGPVPEIRLPQSEPSGPPPGSESVSLQLRDVVLEGSTVYDEAALRRFYAADLGRTVSLARLFEIAAAVETTYREDGYVLSRAIIPAQTVEGGVFRIRIIEGFVSNVVVEGEVGPVRSLIESYAQKITEHRPVNIADIERYLLLINDIPGVTARSVPRPGAGEVGASELVILAQRKWYQGFGFFDNRGSRFLGPKTGGAGVALNSLTSFGEQTQGVLFKAEDGEQYVAQLQYEQRLGSEGLTVGGFVTYGVAYPGGTLEPLDIKSDAFLLNLEVEYPLIRTRPLSLWLRGGFDYIDGETDVINAPFSDDRLRVLYAGGRLEFRDPLLGLNQLRVGIRQGLDILGATDRDELNRSRVQGEADFTLIGGELSRLQPLVYGFSVFARVEGQYSFDPLLAGEEFSLGGLTFGRGYDPAELTGEHGVGLSLELRYSVPDPPAVRDAELYLFYDYGEIWNDDNLPRQDSLESAGAGIRLGVTDWLSAGFEAAKPLTRDLTNRGGRPWRGFFSVTARF